jgi:hypothetical protein
MTRTLTDEQRAVLKSVRRRFRTTASGLEHSSVGFALLAHESPAHRALVEMVPARIRELRDIADLVDKVLEAGEYSAEPLRALCWRIKRCATQTAAICDEALGQLRVPQPKPADGGAP